MAVPRFSALRGLVLLTALAVCSPGAPANTATPPESTVVVFLVRHAEKAEGAESAGDPPLTPAGEKRARALARLLEPAGITHIHSTAFRRTRETAGPLAEALGVEPALYEPRNLDVLATRLRRTPGRHLVVGHSNTTPELAELLGGDGGAPIAEAREYDRLYILVLSGNGRASTTIRQRYGPMPER